jgi:hypothetical protein
MANSVLLKFDSKTVSNSNPSDFSVHYNHFPLDRESDYSLALVSANIWYSWFNISVANGNNTFRYNNGTSWSQTQTIPDGMYSLSHINEYVQGRIAYLGDTSANISIVANYTTLKCDITCQNNYELDLQASQSTLHNILGYNSQILSSTGNLTIVFNSENTVNITNDVNSLSLHCSIVGGSYENSQSSDVIYSFSPNVAPGSLIQLHPNQLLYLPVIPKDSIQNIRFRLTDQSGKSIDLNGEHVNFILHMKKNN